MKASEVGSIRGAAVGVSHNSDVPRVFKLNTTTGEADVKLQSKTGHVLPGGTLRTLILEVALFAPDGTERQKQEISISAENENRLLPNENRVYTFNIRAAVPGDTIKARLMYQLTPKTPESGWVLMAEAVQIVP